MGIEKSRRYCPDDDAMVLAERQTPNDILHLLLTLVTVGLWLPVWVLVSVFGRTAYRCPHCGEKTKARPPWRWVDPRFREEN